MISAAHTLGGMLPRDKILKKCAIWCVLMKILIRFCIKIVILNVISKAFIEQYDDLI